MAVEWSEGVERVVVGVGLVSLMVAVGGGVGCVVVRGGRYGAVAGSAAGVGRIFYERFC